MTKIQKYRWPLVLGLPYLLGLTFEYTPANWFTVPTAFMLVSLWVAAVIAVIATAERS